MTAVLALAVIIAASMLALLVIASVGAKRHEAGRDDRKLAKVGIAIFCVLIVAIVALVVVAPLATTGAL